MERPKPDLELDGLRFRALSRSAFDLIAEVDATGRITYVSPNHTRIHDEAPEALAERLGLGTVVPEDQERIAAHFAAVFGRGDSARFAFRTTEGDGAPRWVECTATPLDTPDGERRALVLSRDVSEQKDLEIRLSASRERFQCIAENAYDMIAEVDESGRVIFANEEMVRSLGIEDERGRLADPGSLIHPDDRERVRETYRQAVQGLDPVAIRYRHALPDGRERTIEARYRRIVNSRDESRCHVIARDITEQIESERRIEESEARYRKLVESSPVGIVVVREGVVAFSNPAGAAVCGAERPEQILGLPMADLLDPEDGAAVSLLMDRIDRGDSVPNITEVRLRGLDGTVREVIATGSRIEYEGATAYQGIVRDVTGLRAAERASQRLELQLQEARKLESLGVLAGGIAHDFNNLLAVILANTRFAHRQVADPEEKEALSEAIDAADQAARLTQQLLAYAGRRSPDVRSTDLSALTRATASLLASALPGGVELSTDLPPALPRVRADVVQLEQVLMNLVMNAGDAMADSPGRVVVSTQRSVVDTGRMSSWVIGADLPPGEYVTLEVRDTGTGMDAATRERIFEPFFTTKRQGHGLGLAAVLGMVRGHDGGLELSTEPGKGTCFRVHLPAIPVQRSDAGAAIVLGVEGRHGADALAEALAGRGMASLEARDLETACDLLRRHGDEVGVAILGAPSGAEGRERIGRLREIEAGLPTLWIGTAPPELLARLQGEGPTEAVGGPDAAGRIRDGLDALLGKID